MSLFTHRARSCHEAGICQRIGTECQRACHAATAWKGDPPIGYEAARVAEVHQLHREARPAATAELPRQDAYEWEWLDRLMAKVSAYFLAAVLVLALVGWVLTTWRGWNTCADSGWLADLCWAIYDLHG